MDSSLLFIIYALALINYELSVAGMAGMNGETMCSDSVPPNINGSISFLPGSTVLSGINATIRCIGFDGIAPKLENPEEYQINKIHIFGPNFEILHTCSGHRECYHDITGIKDLGQFTYLCQFFTLNERFVCSSLKNLTVTGNVCQTKPAPCHRDATCEKTVNSFQCKCNKGFTGDGKNCTGPDCGNNSSCSIKYDPVNCKLSNKTIGCHCPESFIGNGTHCKGILKGCLGPSLCHANASCFKSGGSFACRCHSGFVGNGKHCNRQKCADFKNSSCSIKDEPVNCKLLNKTMGCHCLANFFGNGTHCKVSVIARRSSADSSKIIIVVVVFLLLSVLVIFAVTLSFYRKRRIARQETFSRAVHELHKGRSASKDNLGILFPDEKKDIECSPRRKLPSIREHNSMEEESEEGNIISYICVLDDWEIEKENLTILNKKLGGGYFGVVKKGMYKEKENDDLVVAVKMLKDSASAADRSDLLMELYILKEVNKSPHPNVIKLIGAFTSEEPILVITEFCARGNLRHLLRKSRIPVDNDGDENSSEYKNIFSTLCHRKLLQIAVDISNGMQHLAAHQFVHRDLSARNILIGANYEAKVSDFGLARPITGVDQMYVKSNRNLLPVKWMAVESLTQGIFRTSSDVWAFGIVLWEIATLGEEPYPEISPFETFTLVASGKRMERPAQCSEELYELMKKCWEHEQENRPSFYDIHEQLRGMLAETDHRAYTNVVEMCEEGSDVLTDDRRISLESVGDLRYTKG